MQLTAYGIEVQNKYYKGEKLEKIKKDGKKNIVKHTRSNGTEKEVQKRGVIINFFTEYIVLYDLMICL